MTRFVEGRTDVLVCSSIIENGLDVANANTLIVTRADRFGLSQLYQIRGRVGRWDRRAYCYLVVPDAITPDAEKRLRVLEHYTELGSGYQIAMRDLEVRGAGNLLGEDQSGFAHAVGLDTYMRMMEEAVKRMREAPGREPFPLPEVVMEAGAYLPDAFVADPHQKLHLYRRLSGVSNRREVEKLAAEIADRFGRPPAEARRLLDKALLGLAGRDAGVDRIMVRGGNARVSFRPDVVPRMSALEDALEGEGMKWEMGGYSREFGQPGTDVFGGSHGVPDSFLCFDVADEHEESVRYLCTHVRTPRAGRWALHLGTDSGQVEQAWLNGEALLPEDSGEPVQATTEVVLQEGLNLLLLACVQPPCQPLRAYAALLEPSTTPVRDRPAARLTWFAEPSELVYEIAPHKERRVGWYRCEGPAGTHTLHLNVDGESVQVWVNGAETAVRDGQVQLDAPLADVSQIALRVEQKPGVYAGAAIRQPVRFECADASLPLGDWSQYALESYSGGAVYKKKFTLTDKQLQGEVVLDLGAVNTTAEVAVNGQVVGVRLARPYRFDITGQVHEGANELEVTVYNTLANYFSTGPYESDYVFPGQTVSGLLGPVTVSFPARVMLTARPVRNTSL